ncbi:unnamed protein product [Taenia asiatica]|uniref:Neuroendocrine convertase 2 n=1 Tax=Taenia asiatica TaxID=60517 RepID=A0A0R3WD26_TAEAS|nr:unnamed protein product [Taenia asiatica]
MDAPALIDDLIYTRTLGPMSVEDDRNPPQALSSLPPTLYLRSSMAKRVGLGCLVVLWLSVSLISARIRTNQWLVRLQTDGQEGRDTLKARAKQIAAEIGFRTWLEDHDTYFHPNEFLFLHPNSRQSSKSIQDILVGHPSIESAEQLGGYKRTKRGFRPIENEEQKSPGRALSPLEAEIVRRLSSDPLFRKEWYIHNTGQAEGTPGLDLNVLSAWAQNITGRGVVTAIMDDGIDYLHPDIAPNYAAEASYDFSGNDAFPYPRYTDDWFNSHGTRCAGEIAAVAGNGVCGVGVAPNSRVAGLRMLDQPYMTDLIEAAAMSQARDIIDIYSASWGPTDDGKTVDGPRNQTMQAIVDGVNKGRGGKGSLFVWASGDGGPEDDCNCDGYAASMWTISINSATNDGQTASYDESCASTLASTFSNGKSMLRLVKSPGFEEIRGISDLDAGVGTVDLYGNCTLHHSGTSAAAPEAAGVLALALEANPELTWRDMQHLIVLTSKRNHLYDREGTHNWTINGAGLEFNHLFGYGVLDAGDMVRMAKMWKTVPERFHCIAGIFNGRKVVTVGKPIQLELYTESCQGNPESQVNFIEHVQAFISIRASRRGDLVMFLTSPMNTTSMILGARPKDSDSRRGFTKWPFMTTHMWAESPRGTWKLTVGLDPQKHRTHKGADPALGHAVLTEWILMIHGTQEPPYTALPESASQLVPKLGLVKRQHLSERFST